MKKILFLMTLLVVGVSFAFAQTNADIKFDKTTHDFGKFSENSPVVRIRRLLLDCFQRTFQSRVLFCQT